MKRCLSLHVIPDFFILEEYLGKSELPAIRPNNPANIGALAVCADPSKAWQAEHYESKIARPAVESPFGITTSGSVIPFFLGGILI